MTARKAAFVVLALLLATVGVTGVAIEAMQVLDAVRASGALSEGAVVTMPRRGDRVVFDVEVDALVGGELAGSPYERAYEFNITMAFEWTGAGTVVDGVGRTLEVERVRGAYRGSWHPDLPEGDGLPLNFTFQRGAVAAVTTDYEGSWRRPVTFKVPGSPPAGEWAWQLVGTEYASTAPYSCLLRAGWQGRSPETMGATRYADACPGVNLVALFDMITPAQLLPRAQFPPDALLAPVGWSQAGAAESFVLRVEAEGVEAPWALGQRATYRVAHEWWLTPGIPYPTRFVERLDYVASSETNGIVLERQHGTRVTTIDLTGFSPGAEPAQLAGEPPAPPSRRADVTFGPLTHDGPSEGDEPLPFPLARAVQHAREDPTLRDFHEWLKRHSEARLAFAHFHASPVPDTPELLGRNGYTWDLQWAEPGGERWRVSVSETQALPEQVRGLPPELRPRSSASHGAMQTWAFDDAPLPREVVTVESALALLNATQPRAREMPGRDVVFSLAGETPWETGHLTAWAFQEYEESAQELAGEHAWVKLDLATGALLTESELRDTATITPMPAIADSGGRPREPSNGRLSPSVAEAAARLSLLALLGLLFQVPIARFLLAPLYTRLARSSALENATRAAIVEAVRASPGIHRRGLLVEVPCGNGAMSYHLEVLRRTGHLTRVDSGRYARWFVSGTGAREELARASALMAGSAERLHALVEETPGLTQRELARKLRVSDAAVHYTLRRLEQNGLVERRREGRSVRVHPREGAVVRALASPLRA